MPDSTLLDRLADLEVRLTYQDETLHVLSAEVARQQRRIDDLERTCRELARRAVAAATDAPLQPSAEEVPPHY